MTERLQSRRGPSVLGLAFDGRLFQGVLLRRTNGSAQITHSFSAPLSVDPLKADAALVGRELRKALDDAGIRERRCAVCLPPEWTLSVHTQLPDLPEADEGSFLALEAERGFPYAPEALVVCRSRGQIGGRPYVLQVGVPREQIHRMETLLRAAHLIPVSFSLGLPALQPPDTTGADGVLALALGRETASAQLSFGGGIAALRTLSATVESADGTHALEGASIVRELRITLGQLPAAARSEVRRLRLFGDPGSTRRVSDELQPHADRLGLVLELVASPDPAELGVQLPPGTTVSPALNLAARFLAGRASGFEFLPPRLPVWRQMVGRYSSRKLVTAGAVSFCAVLLAALPFIVQQWQLSRLESAWRTIGPKVRDLERIQQQARQFRPWFDESFRSLSILKTLTEAFPEDGAVFARAIEFREPLAISCSGVARDQAALMKTLDQLRAVPRVANLKVDQMQGRAPMQFTFNFQWNPGGQP